MNFSYVVLYVKDIRESMGFYQDVIGMERERFFEEDGVKKAFMVQPGKVPMVEEPMIELVEGMANMPTAQAGELIGFTVDDLEKTVALLNEKGYPLLKGPYSPAPGVTIYEYRGPDGERVGVMNMEEE